MGREVEGARVGCGDGRGGSRGGGFGSSDLLVRLGDSGWVCFWEETLRVMALRGTIYRAIEEDCAEYVSEIAMIMG